MLNKMHMKIAKKYILIVIVVFFSSCYHPQPASDIQDQIKEDYDQIQKEQMSIFLPDGKPHPFLTMLVAVLGAMAEMEADNIRYRLKSGRDKYVRDGGKLGRPEGTRKSVEAYERDYPQVIKELRRKDRESYDRIAKLTGTSKRTIITIARMLGLTQDQQQPPVTIHTPDPTDEKIEQ